MLGDSWPIVVAVFVLAGALYGQKALFILGVMLLLVQLLITFWSRWALWRLEYTRKLSEYRAFVGEKIELTVRVSNSKPLPVTWLEVREEIDLDLRVVQGTVLPSPKPGINYIGENTSLGWYEAVTWHYFINCSRRGYYKIGPANIRSGDIFGLFQRRLTVGQSDYLIVYPKTFALKELGLPERRPFGDSGSRQRLFEDPTRVAGLREYRSDDPFKRIDWKASARHQKLQVKVYEPTTSLYLHVLLNIDTFEHPWQGHDPVVLERGISVAASVARYACEHHWSVGIAANGSMPGSARPIKVNPNSAPEQLLRVLEALALVAPFTTSSIEVVIKEEGQRLPWGSTVVVVSALATEGIWAEMNRLKDAGYLVYFLYSGIGNAPRPTDSIPVYDVGQFIRVEDVAP
ncbi:MAG: DUF58 domain-containing protein [Dehalococcoidia bacterium]|nr:DUF58 domain-containing protein [Dehalococcoidia bacterium]